MNIINTDWTIDLIRIVICIASLAMLFQLSASVKSHHKTISECDYSWVRK